MRSPTSPRRPARPPRLESYRRVNLRLPKGLHTSLIGHSESRRTTATAIAEQALRTFLDPRQEDNRDAMLARRLQRVDGKLLRIASQLRITTEAVGALSEVLLGVLPEPRSREEKAQYVEKVRRRAPKLLEAIVARLSDSQREGLGRLGEEFTAGEADFAKASDAPSVGAAHE